MIDDIESLARTGKWVIVDANLKTNDTRQMFYDTAYTFGLKPVVVEFFATDEDSRQRLANRGSLGVLTEHPLDPAVFDRQKPLWQDIKLDFTLPENQQLTWIRFNSSHEKGEIKRVLDADQEFVQKLVTLLEETSI